MSRGLQFTAVAALTACWIAASPVAVRSQPSAEGVAARGANPPKSLPSSTQRKKFAICVGVEGYKSGSGFGGLNYAADDAVAVAESLLANCGFDSVALLADDGDLDALEQRYGDRLTSSAKTDYESIEYAVRHILQTVERRRRHRRVLFCRARFRADLRVSGAERLRCVFDRECDPGWRDRRLRDAPADEEPSHHPRRVPNAAGRRRDGHQFGFSELRCPPRASSWFCGRRATMASRPWKTARWGMGVSLGCW